MLLEELVRESCEKEKLPRDVYRFSRRAVCEHTGWSLTQVRLHLHRLVEHELVLVHRTARGQGFVYELCAAPTTPGDIGLADMPAATMGQVAGVGGVIAQVGPPGKKTNDTGLVSASWRGDGKSTLVAEAAVHRTVAVPRATATGSRKTVAS